MDGRRHTPLRYRRTVAAAGMLTVCVGCMTGKILVNPVEFLHAPASPKQITLGVRGVDRSDTNKYQGEFEKGVVDALSASGAFKRVLYGDFPSSEVDAELRLGPATLWLDRVVHPAYFPVALVTLTVYIWVGGPIMLDYQQYAVDIAAHRPDGSHLFDLAVANHFRHGVNLYAREYGERICRGPDFDKFLGQLVESVEREFSAKGML